MKELEVYDTMMAEYYESITTQFLPLSSWEFYGEHNAFLHSSKQDLDSLQKITKKWNFNNDYHHELVNKKSVIVITSADLKIVFASHNIEKMTGYAPEEVIGSSPKIFQGKDTDPKTSEAIRNAINKKQPFEASILNYKKDNSTYICEIKGFPVCDKRGKLINYIAFEKAA
ncbi:PAS domain-containing protein [Aquimarina sp. 2201CG14-23]|uniref:PAS domain-containing protein n=1 Tax=Aquimarina mycalae TaxID=3040073 RepID=UPI0024781C68|nr:PAS domain-containing protein [Aquimarina sp. 2201CG14-23]MDH7446973.1 PAS domain-containing protein [Aquimarina sp. 2201CG14-23]